MSETFGSPVFSSIVKSRTSLLVKSRCEKNMIRLLPVFFACWQLAAQSGWRTSHRVYGLFFQQTHISVDQTSISGCFMPEFSEVGSHPNPAVFGDTNPAVFVKSKAWVPVSSSPSVRHIDQKPWNSPMSTSSTREI